MAKALNVSLAVTADTSQAKAQLQQLQNTLQQLTANSANLQIGIDPKQIQEASKYALDLSAHLKTATDPTTGMLNFTKFESQIKHSGKSIQEYGQQLLNLGPQGRQAFTQMTEAIAKSEIPMKRMSGVLGQFGTVIANTIRWQASSSLIHGFMGSIQQAYNYAQDLNKSLNNIQIVTQMSDTQMGKFAESANKAAKSLSTTTTSYTDAALIYYQQGIRDQNEINERTNATIKMANVTGQSAQQVSNQMTAIWNNFSKGGENLEYYADVITALGAATASSSEEISKGLEKFAATADTVGLSYENATAALATITATTRQSADSVGTGLRTLFARLDSLKLGETLEDGVDLTKYTKALQSVGVQVLDTNGNLKRMDDILNDLGERWGDISDTQKVALAQTVGGVRQYTTLMALMNNFDFYKENVEIAKGSEGTLQKQQEVYEKSWAASAKRVRASLETIYSSLINDQFFISLNDGFAKVLDVINNIIAGLGGMKGILLGLGGVLTATFSPQITQGLYNFGIGVSDTLGAIVGKDKAADRRAQAVNDLTAMYMGMAPTGKPIDISTLTESQQFQYDAFKNQMTMQQTYAQNAQYMTPWQQQAAQIGMDQYNQMNQQIINQRQKLQETQTQLAIDLGAARAPMALNNMNSSTIDQFLGSITQESGQWAKTLEFLQPDRLKELLPNMTREDVDTLLGSSVGGISKDDRNAILDELINGEDKDTGLITDFDIAAARTLAQNRYGTFRQGSIESLISEGHLDRSLATRILEGSYNNEKGQLDLSLMSEQDKILYENAQRAVQAKSTGMKVASNITNIAGGTMSALAASQQIDALANSIQGISDGSLSMGEGLTQAFSAASMGAMNLGRSMQQLQNSFLGPVWGSIIAIAMTVLPQVIKGIDTLFTSPAERLDNLHQSTEQAEQLATNAKAAYDNLLNSFSSHSSAVDALSELTKGTLEYEAALIRANDAAYQLINENNLTSEDFYTDENGVVQIRQEAQERVQQQALDRMQQTQGQALAAKSLETNYQTQMTTDEATKVYESAIKDIEQNAYRQAVKADSSLWTSALGTTPFTALPSDYERNVQRFNERLQNEVYSQIDYTAELNKNKAIQYQAEKLGLTTEQFVAQMQSGDFQRQQMIKSGAATQNQLLAQNILSQQTGNAELSKTDQLLAQAWAQNVERQNAINDTSRMVVDARYRVENGKRVEVGDDTVDRAGIWGKKYDLSSDEIYNSSVGELEDVYLKAVQQSLKLTEDEARERLSGLTKSDEYKKASSDERKKMLVAEAQSAMKYAFADESLKEARKAIDKDPKLRKQFDNFGKATMAEAAQVFADTQSNSDPDIQMMGQAFFDQYQKAYQGFMGDVYSSMSDVDFSTKEGQAKQDAYKKLAERLNPEEFEKLSDLKDNLINAVGDTAGNKAFADIIDNMATSNGNLRKMYESLDFTGGGLSILSQLKSGTTGFGKFDTGTLAEQTYNELVEAMGGDQGIFEQMYGSADFQESLKDLNKEFEKTGEISATSILKAAETSESLAAALENSSLNAEGLSNILEQMSLGNLNADQITSGLIAAFSAAGALEDELAKVYAHIDQFQEKRSAADIGDFYGKRVSSITKSLKQGIFADEPLLQNFQELFGAERTGEYFDWAAKSSKLSQKELDKSWADNFAAEIKAMKSIQENGNLEGMYDYYFGQTKGQDLGQYGTTGITNQKGTIQAGGKDLMHYDQKTQELVVDDMAAFQSMFQSSSDFAQFLTDNLGVSADMAASMAAETGQYNAEIQQAWKKNDIAAGEQALIDAATGPNAEVMTIDQLKAFQNAYGAFDESLRGADGLKKLMNMITEAGGSVVDLGDNFNYAAESYEELDKMMGDQEGETTLSDYLAKEGAGKEQKRGFDADKGEPFDYDVTKVEAAQKAFQKLGYTGEQAAGVIDDAFNNGKSMGELAFQVRNAAGGFKEIDTSSADFQKFLQDAGGLADGFGNSITAAIEAYQQKMQSAFENQQAATAFAEGFKAVLGDGIEITFIDSNSGEVIQALKDTKPEVPITWTYDAIKYSGSVDVAIHWTYPEGKPEVARGMNNAKGFAGGYHSNNDFEGIAETGELGPELWVHDGQPALTGVHGRNKIFVSEGDQIFTAAQTREILRDNPSLQGIPGYDGGINNKNSNTSGSRTYRGITDPLGGTSGGSGGGGGGKSDKKSEEYDPERYHVISRQITALTRIFDRLTKAKENAYGTNILDAMDAEIEAQDKLIEKQKELIKEVEEYKKQDLKDLDKLKVKYELDENGNISNWDELQKKYEKKAQNGDEKAKKIWEAIQQYEETIDKLEEERDKLQEQIRKRAELELAKITTKAELKIKFDEKQIKLIEYQLDKISDNIYKSAEALALVGQHMDRITRSMSTTRDAIDDIFNKMADQDGNPISMTLEQFLAMSTAEQDALHINGEYGRQIEEYIEDLLSYNEELLEFKTKGVEQLAEAFDELTSKIEKSMDLFGYYNGILSTMKDIVELQNIKFPKELRSSVQDVSNALASVNEDNIVAQKEYYQALSEEADNIREKLARTTDFDLQQQYQEQLDQLEEKMRTCMSDLTTLWQQGLQQAQDDLNRSLDWIVEDYESAIAGMYGNLSMLQDAFDREQKVRERYAEDYEKYYQLNKLQRTINKDLDKAAVNGYKANKNLAALLEHIQELQESGADVSAYDLELLQKRYEYYKALADLEDARNAKSQVRLQRDRNGNWTYVYTANEDELEDLQQAADDKLYELQKFVRESSDDLEKQIQDLVSNYTQQRVEMIKQGASAEALAEFDKYFEDQLAYLNGEWNKTLTDAGSTVDMANERYKIDSFDIIDTFGETISAQVSSAQSTEELMNTATNAMLTAAGAMDFAVNAYGDTIERLNTLLGGEGDFATNFQSFVASIQEASNINLGVTQEQIDNFKTTYKEVLDLADEFEKEFFEKFQAIIDKNEELIQQLTDALEKLNNIQQEQDDKKDDDKKKKKKKKKKDDDGGGGSGSGGGGGSGSGGGGGGSSTKDEKVTYGAWSSWKSYGSSGHKRSRVKFVNGKQSGIEWQTGSHDQKKRVTTGNKIARYCTVCGYAWPLIDAPTSGGCFAPGTQILMADYTTKNIEDVLVGDYVVAYNEQTKVYEPKQVLYSFAHYNTQEIIDIYLSNNTILTATMCHPILTTEGWKSLNHDIALYEHEIETTPLNIGQIIVGYNEQYEIINIINRFDLYGSITYNITIEDDHTYIANNCIVHNMAMQATQMKYDTGGYTGNWGSTEGKWAILHEKEQVFNKDDTAKLLMASKILQTIDIQARYASGAYNHLSSPSVGATEQNIQQEVKIEAQFPNATNHSEIEQAFNNLSNKAIQYANRKR